MDTTKYTDAGFSQNPKTDNLMNANPFDESEYLLVVIEAHKSQSNSSHCLQRSFLLRCWHRCIIAGHRGDTALCTILVFILAPMSGLLFVSALFGLSPPPWLLNVLQVTLVSTGTTGGAHYWKPFHHSYDHLTSIWCVQWSSHVNTNQQAVMCTGQCQVHKAHLIFSFYKKPGDSHIVLMRVKRCLAH